MDTTEISACHSVSFLQDDSAWDCMWERDSDVGLQLGSACLPAGLGWWDLARRQPKHSCAVPAPPSFPFQNPICQTQFVVSLNMCIWCWILELARSWGAVVWSPETEAPHWREREGARWMSCVWSMKLDKSGITHSDTTFDWVSFWSELHHDKSM